jgi:DNA-binding transcriptional MerR regulator
MSRRSKANLAATPARPPQEEPERLFTIGELAREHGITTRTIRFYESKNLINPGRKGVARAYSRRDRARLILILRGKNLGFTLEEIKEFLDMRDADPEHLKQTQALLGRIEQRIGELVSKQSDIERTLAELQTVRAHCVDHLKKAGSG